MASSGCGCAASPAHKTSSNSPHRAEPQDNGAASGLASARPRDRVSCVRVDASHVRLVSSPQSRLGANEGKNYLNSASQQRGGPKPVALPTLSTASTQSRRRTEFGQACPSGWFSAGLDIPSRIATPGCNALSPGASASEARSREYDRAAVRSRCQQLRRLPRIPRRSRCQHSGWPRESTAVPRHRGGSPRARNR